MEKQWYEKLFTNYANSYDKEPFTQGTLGECDFIEQEMNKNTDKKLLDIGCGTGRHSIELTTRGYNIMGVDLSTNQLGKAREKAKERGLNIRFEQMDARKLPFENEFEGAIMLCEGGFSLMETDEMNFAILQSAARALKPGGKLIFNALNALFPLNHSVKDFLNGESDKTTESIASYDDFTFNMMTLREHSTIEIVDDTGKPIKLETSERYYIPSEITWMLKSLGFTQVDIYGAHLGEFSREHALTAENYEMLIIAELGD